MNDRTATTVEVDGCTVTLDGGSVIMSWSGFRCGGEWDGEHVTGSILSLFPEDTWLPRIEAALRKAGGMGDRDLRRWRGMFGDTVEHTCGSGCSSPCPYERDE